MNGDDSHLPVPGQFCISCWKRTDHLVCWDTDLDLADVNPQIALHDAALAVTGEHH